MDDALRLRHRMIPYLHTMNWRASRTGLPLVEPMYWGSPDIDAAYHVPNEYMFGTELLAAPITEPMDKSCLSILIQTRSFAVFDGRFLFHRVPSPAGWLRRWLRGCHPPQA